MQPEDDEVPVADAAEQHRDVKPPPGDDDAIQPNCSPPLESNESDWQEQRVEVDLDPELDGVDRED
ncbi:hypothetical protein A5784_36500 [Mycobacterium sp. 852013-50091_SCH5140682]|uniref:hypothetical protein n=1 Tax=Mycobacterium sp. 852013-50091_SCH5140682 TaxID=1834109 RepID=UPI0007EBFAB9|nr:hypothetical protein [Mycobacterium sp. 852013-50091_SCH5140682]OBC10524.1 hypothetical protein A5784_36500 [Mycobacterium sp. 852013-50091_SCH5140682]